MKRKVLWFSNCPITETHGGSTGTWLSAMAHALVESGEIALTNISQAKLAKPTRRDCGDIHQWLFPIEQLNKHGLPPSRTTHAIRRIVEDVAPDLLHVWGTENYWGLLTSRKMIQGPTILEMQGIKYACAEVYYGGLSFSELLRCIGPLELLRPSSSIFLGKRRFKNWGKFEKEMICNHDTISTQSNWVRSYVNAVNPNARLIETGILLRKEFYQASSWSMQADPRSANTSIFTISSGAAAYKGLHVLFRAISILKNKFPNISLKIAGNQIAGGLRKSGYVRWIEGESRRLEIQERIQWLGPLDAAGIINQIQHSLAVVIPSFIESYCLALAEAMYLGAPLVVSYAGAMPELAQDETSALFFPMGDAVACAAKIEHLLNFNEVATRIGENARAAGLNRNNPADILARQLQIYELATGYRNKL